MGDELHESKRMPLAMLAAWAELNEPELERCRHFIYVRDAILWTMTVGGVWAIAVAFSC